MRGSLGRRIRRGRTGQSDFRSREYADRPEMSRRGTAWTLRPLTAADPVRRGGGWFHSAQGAAHRTGARTRKRRRGRRAPIRPVGRPARYRTTTRETVPGAEDRPGGGRPHRTQHASSRPRPRQAAPGGKRALPARARARPARPTPPSNGKGSVCAPSALRRPGHRPRATAAEGHPPPAPRTRPPRSGLIRRTREEVARREQGHLVLLTRCSRAHPDPGTCSRSGHPARTAPQGACCGGRGPRPRGVLSRTCSTGPWAPQVRQSSPSTTTAVGAADRR